MNNKSTLKFKLYADCIPVKGYIRSAIYDLNRRTYKFIPNSMIEFITEASGKNISEIKRNYDSDCDETIDEYIDFLEKNEFVCWLPDVLLENFVPMDFEYDYPADITNAIIDIDVHSSYSVVGALKKLENLGCKSVQIRSFSFRPIEFFDSILAEFIDSSYLTIEIITLFSDVREIEVSKFIESHSRIKALVFHTAPYNKVTNQKGKNIMGTLAYTRQIIKSATDCHNNSEEYFNVSIPLFSESLLHHPYFNRKVSVDTTGIIKNCSSHNKEFGNVEKCEIAGIIKQHDFQQLWNVSRDKIVVCRDCEFRYMCSDSTLPILISEGVWKLSTECNYNPYIGKWKSEEGYSTVDTFIKNKDNPHFKS